MRFFYVTIFALRVEGADCTVNQLCSNSTACKCKDAGDCNSDKKVCVPEGIGKKLIELTADNQLTAGENATAAKHFCVSAVGNNVFKCVFEDADNASNEACNPHGAPTKSTICPKSNTVLKAGDTGTGAKLCIGRYETVPVACPANSICNPDARGPELERLYSEQYSLHWVYWKYSTAYYSAAPALGNGAWHGPPLCEPRSNVLTPGEEAVRMDKTGCLHHATQKIITCEIGKVCNPSAADADKVCVDNTKVLGPGEKVDGERKLCIGRNWFDVTATPVSKNCTGTRACKPSESVADKLCVESTRVLGPREKGDSNKGLCLTVAVAKGESWCRKGTACDPFGGFTPCIDENTLVMPGEETRSFGDRCVGRLGMKFCLMGYVCDASAPSDNMCVPKIKVAEIGKASGGKVCIATDGITRRKVCKGEELCQPAANKTDELCVDAAVARRTIRGAVAPSTKDKPAPVVKPRTGAVGMSPTEIILFSLFGVLFICVCIASLLRLYRNYGDDGVKIAAPLEKTRN